MKPNPKPIRTPVVKGHSIPRVPYSEPLTPGLRREGGAQAIGFTARICAEDWND